MRAVVVECMMLVEVLQGGIVEGGQGGVDVSEGVMDWDSWLSRGGDVCGWW